MKKSPENCKHDIVVIGTSVKCLECGKVMSYREWIRIRKESKDD